MAKERNRHGEQQQICELNSNLWKAMKAYLAGGSEEPFEYRHKGFLFSEAKLRFQKLGFELEWNRNPESDEESYWSFTMPRDTAASIQDFR